MQNCENDFFYYQANKTHFHKKGLHLASLLIRVSVFTNGNGFFHSFKLFPILDIAFELF